VPDRNAEPRRGRRGAVDAPVGPVVSARADEGRAAARTRHDDGVGEAARGHPRARVRGRRALPGIQGSSRRSSRTATSSTCASSSRATEPVRLPDLPRRPAQAGRLVGARRRAHHRRVHGAHDRRKRHASSPTSGSRLGAGGGARDPAPAQREAHLPPAGGLGYLTLSRRRGRSRRRGAGGSTWPTSWVTAGRRALCAGRAVDRLHARDTARSPSCVTSSRRRQHGGGRRARPRVHRTADHIVELGPGSGERGGEIVFSGPQAEFRRATHSLTARTSPGVSRSRYRPFGGPAGARSRWWALTRQPKHVTFRLPLNTLTAVSGRVGLGASPPWCTTPSIAPSPAPSRPTSRRRAPTTR